MNDGPIDRARLAALLGGDDVAWLRARVRQRVEQGAQVTGIARLAGPTPAQRAAADRLMGRRPSTGTHVTVSLDAIDRTLRDAQICAGLTTAVQALDGPIRNRRAERLARAARWERLAADALATMDAGLDGIWARRWIDELCSTGLLRRLAADADDARRLLDQAQAVLAVLPARGVSIAGLAARVLGDSHGLDDGRALTTVVLKGLQHRVGIAARGPLPTGEERRALWASVGVLGDELSSTVLALAIPGDDPTAGGAQGIHSRRHATPELDLSLTDAVLRLHAAAGEPVRLTLSQLVRHPPGLSRLDGSTVFVCENPAVVAAAARRLGAACAPLVCVEGQPSAAAQTLLRRCVEAGARLVYHGDFDWSGLRIGQLVIDRFSAVPWRFATADYLAAPGGPPLRGRRAAASWDPHLDAAMTARGTAVHEEQVLADLLADLA